MRKFTMEYRQEKIEPIIIHQGHYANITTVHASYSDILSEPTQEEMDCFIKSNNSSNITTIHAPNNKNSSD